MLSYLRKLALPIVVSVLAPAGVAAASLATMRSDPPTFCEFYCGCKGGPMWCCSVTGYDAQGYPIWEGVCDTFIEFPEG